MKRKVDIEEIRRFFDACIAQFDESNIILHSVRFIRDEEGKMTQISLNYSEIDINYAKMKKTQNRPLSDPHRGNYFSVRKMTNRKGWLRTRSNPTLCPKQKRKYLKRNKADRRPHHCP